MEAHSRDHRLHLEDEEGVMAFASGVLARLRWWWHSATNRRRLEVEMEAELAHHLDQLTANLVRCGDSPEDAARSARIALGAPDPLTGGDLAAQDGGDGEPVKDLPERNARGGSSGS